MGCMFWVKKLPHSICQNVVVYDERLPCVPVHVGNSLTAHFWLGLSGFFFSSAPLGREESGAFGVAVVFESLLGLSMSQLGISFGFVVVFTQTLRSHGRKRKTSLSCSGTAQLRSTSPLICDVKREFVARKGFRTVHSELRGCVCTKVCGKVNGLFVCCRGGTFLNERRSYLDDLYHKFQGWGNQYGHIFEGGSVL
ncbi:hypothetical protein MATL_G00249760 [Megalops atlanticus]|uniref:Uncharacterized protein n=1 Tax=Megalops atlanticus TaxID=7932 RepID=A0A9D3PB83_MEGAT|nr:hypothetical protein MATL_G00249760 [Megalops atlanticus]